MKFSYSFTDGLAEISCSFASAVLMMVVIISTACGALQNLQYRVDTVHVTRDTLPAPPRGPQVRVLRQDEALVTLRTLQAVSST